MAKASNEQRIKNFSAFMRQAKEQEKPQPPQPFAPTLAQCIWLQNNFDSILKEASK